MPPLTGGLRSGLMDDAARARAELAIAVLDLTDLSADASEAGADALCQRAAAAGTAAVCIWPAFVARCVEHLNGTGVRVATVINFPTGDEPLERATSVAAAAVAAGADELDVVLPYRAWLAGDVQVAADMLTAVRQEAGDRVMKVIIESGSLTDPAAIDRASHFAIANGADFVKTSTGKTDVSATPEAAEIILEAIDVSGRPVGFKASGGIRTLADANVYLDLAETIMGSGWPTPQTFRFGASGLLRELSVATGHEY